MNVSRCLTLCLEIPGVIITSPGRGSDPIPTDRYAALEPPDISLEIKEKGRSGRGAGWEGLVTLETCQAVLLSLL